MTISNPFARRPRAIDLRDTAQYRLLYELDMRNPMDFFRRYLFNINLGSLAFFIFALVTIAMFATELASNGYVEDSKAVQVVLALIGSLLIVPVHEGIHAITYKAIGAPAVKFVTEWSKGLIYTVADRFVVDQREYVWLAFTPLFVISLFLGGAYFLAPEYDVLIAGLLCFHTLSCIGDIAIINFLWVHRDEAVFSYDDLKVHKSYFYARLENLPTDTPNPPTNQR